MTLGPRVQRQGSVSVPILLLVIVLASIATAMCYRAVQSRFGNELRTAAHRELSQLFPMADIFVGRVTFDDCGTIVINDLRMAVQVAGDRRPVVIVEQIFLRGQFDISDILKQTARVEQVHLVGLQLDAWSFADGSWSLEHLKPQPRHKHPPPDVVVDRASIRIRKDMQADSSEILLHDIHASAQVVDTETRIGADSNKQLLHYFHVKVTGKSSGLLAGLAVDCHFDSAFNSIEVTGSASGLHFSKRLLDQLPNHFGQKMTQLAGLECEASCSDFRVSLGSGRPPEFSCQGTIEAGRLRDGRLPYPLEQISSGFFFKNSLLQLRNVSARSGGASLRIDTDILGMGLDSPMVIQAKVQNLDLDQRLYESLPQHFQSQWDRLQLSGRISGDVELRFDGSKWQQSATIQCLQVAIQPWLFPYPFTQIEGLVNYQDGVLSSEKLVGKAGGQSVEAQIRLKQTESQWLGRLQCKSHGPVAIDEEMIAALTPSGKPTGGAESFIRSLHLAGAVELVNVTFERSDSQNLKWNRKIDAHIYDGRLLYEKFQYPIYNIRGRIVNENDRWQLEAFEGRNDSARILFSGQWQQVEKGTMPFSLLFEAFTVPLAEDLHRAVPQQVRNAWSHLQPTGTIGQIVTTVRREAGEPNIDTQVTITEQTDSRTQPGKTLRLFPRLIPYQLNDVNFQVVYRDGVVVIDHATAQNGATRLAIRGTCKALPDGNWHGDIWWLPTTRLMVDGQLVKAMPRDIQESMQKLSLEGPVSVLGRSEIIFGDPDSKPDVYWDCQFDIEDGLLAGGEHFNSMRGTVWAQGNSLQGKVSAAGQVSMDALRVLKVPVTNLQGPFKLQENKLYFGEAARNEIVASDNFQRQMTAQALSGTLRLNGNIVLETGRMNLDAALEDADLNNLMLELGVPQQDSQATCNVTLKDFRGIPWNPQTFHGSGSIHLSNAKIYQLPFMMRLLSVASVNASDDSAFQNADIQFNIDGDHIPLKVAADGEVLRVRGEGWTNLRRDVDLQLYTYVGRKLPIGQAVSPLLAESRFATFMMVEVTGSLDNPTMQRRPFPQIEATIQQIFPEVADQRPIRDAINRWRN